MPSIGAACYELRINDTGNDLKWRIIYHISDEAIVVLGSFQKKTGKTPKQLIDNCRKRLKEYHSLMNTEQMS